MLGLRRQDGQLIGVLMFFKTDSCAASRKRLKRHDSLNFCFHFVRWPLKSPRTAGLSYNTRTSSCVRKGKERIRKVCTPFEYIFRPLLLIGFNLYIFGFTKTLHDHALLHKCVPLNKEDQVGSENEKHSRG
jgi:hypothetical protein